MYGDISNPTCNLKMLNSVKCGPGQKIYAQCVNRSGSKCFFAASYDEMWHRMQTSPRHYSEVIKDAPCHLFMDFDKGDVHAAWSQIKPFINKMLDKFGLDYTHVLLDSSDSTKQSLHVVTVCNKFLVGSPTQILYLLYHLKENEEDIDLSTIDTSVYTRNRCFRMLGSTKIGSNRVLRGNWTKQHWINTLVQPDTDLELYKQWASIGATHTKSRSDDHPPCAIRALEWIGAKRDYRKRYVLSWTFWGHLYKAVCPFVGRVHSHNNIYFSFRLGFPEVMFKCHSCQKKYTKELPLDIQEEITQFLNGLV